MVVKTGIALPKELVNELDKFMRTLKIDNRSRIISEALRTYLDMNKALLTDEELVSVITIFYSNDAAGIKVISIKHEYKDLILTSNHVDFPDRCLELLVVKGSSNKIAEFLGKLLHVNGIDRVNHIPITTVTR